MARRLPKNINLQGDIRKRIEEVWDMYDSVLWVTMVTLFERMDLGTVVDGRMQLSLAGETLSRYLTHLHMYYPMLVVPSFVILPNHFHAIVMVRADFPGCFDSDCFQNSCDRVLDALSINIPVVERSGIYKVVNINTYQVREVRKWEINDLCTITETNVSKWHEDIYSR